MLSKLTICSSRKPQFDSWVGKIHWRRDRLLTPAFLGLTCGSAGKESARNAGALGLILGLGRSSGEGKGYPLQYSGLENSMDSIIVHGVTKSQTEWNDFHFHTHTHTRRSSPSSDRQPEPEGLEGGNCSPRETLPIKLQAGFFAKSSWGSGQSPSA